jgi:hypothetical protein
LTWETPATTLFSCGRLHQLQKFVVKFSDERDIYQFADQVVSANAAEMLDEAIDSGAMKPTGAYAHFLRETVKRKQSDVVIRKKQIGEVVAQYPAVKPPRF